MRGPARRASSTTSPRVGREGAQVRPALSYSGEVSDSGPVTEHRAERVLAFMFAAVVGLSILAFLAVIIGTAAGAAEADGFSQPPWPFIIMLPWFGLPIGFLLLIALLIVNWVRRSREPRTRAS